MGKIKYHVENIYIQKNKYGSNIINNVINISSTSKNDRYLTYMPAQPKVFLGRKKELEEIDHLLQEHNHVIIQGISGIGKTSLCQYYAAVKQSSYKHVAWVRIKDNLASDFIDQFKLDDIHYENFDDINQRFEKLLVFLNNNYMNDEQNQNNTLIFIDNFNYPSFSDLQKLHSLHMKILITARARGQNTNENPFFIYPLDILDEADCVSLFRIHYKKDVDYDEDLRKIILNFAKRHTLLVQMTAQIAQYEQWSIPELLDRLKIDDDINFEYPFRCPANDWSGDEELKIEETVQRLFDIMSLSGDECSFLAVIALFDASPIPLDFLKQVIKRNSWRILMDLCNKGWLQENRNSCFWLHPIVKSVIQKYHLIEYVDCIEIIREAASFLWKLVNEETDMNHSLSQVYFPHIKSLLQSFEKENSKEIADLSYTCSKHLVKMGLYSEALIWQLKAVSIHEKVLPCNHPDLAVSYNSLSNIYHYIGKYKDALNTQIKATTIFEKAYPEYHSDLAAAYNDLAVIYKEDFGKYYRALPIQKKSVSIYEHVLPATHPNLASAYHTLASIYREISEYDKALSYQLKSITIFKKSPAKYQPDLASAYHNLSLIYLSMDKYEDALPTQHKAIDINENILPSNHPSLSINYSILSRIYRYLGEYDHALRFQFKAIEIYKNNRLSEHPNLATFYNDLSSIYQDMGKYEEALQWQIKNIDITEKHFSKESPRLASSYAGLALIYKALGKYNDALTAAYKDINISKKSLPNNHTDLAISYNNLASIYDGMKKYNDALIFQYKAIDIDKKKLPDSPSLASDYQNLSLIYKSMEKYDDALNFQLVAVAIYESSLPVHHPFLANSYNKLANIYEAVGNYKEAKKWQQKANEIDTKNSKKPWLSHP